MKKIHWIRIWQKFKPKWSFNRFGKKKTLLAFEFGIVLSEALKDLKIDMTKDIVVKTEKLLETQLSTESPETFAGNMNVYILAILEPKN